MSGKLSRPRILTLAAKAGAALYDRERDLRRLLPRLLATRDVRRVISAIGAAEAACEAERTGGAATYSPARHIALLAALLAETRLRSAA